MELPENVAPMPAEQRAELKRLAEAAQKGWASNIVGWHVASNLWEYHDMDNEDSAFISAMRPGVALGTLAYVEALEAEVQRLTDGTVSNEVYTARTDAYVADLDQLRARLATTEAERDGLKQELAEQEVNAMQWAKALASHKNEISRLRATSINWIAIAEQDAPTYITVLVAIDNDSGGVTICHRTVQRTSEGWRYAWAGEEKAFTRTVRYWAYVPVFQLHDTAARAPQEREGREVAGE